MGEIKDSHQTGDIAKPPTTNTIMQENERISKTSFIISFITLPWDWYNDREEVNCSSDAMSFFDHRRTNAIHL